MYNYNKL